MGSCLSRVLRSRRTRSSESSSSAAASTAEFAKVISINGDLRQYPTPALVSDVLSSENSSTSSSSSSSTSFFVCNSDNLYYDEIIPALPADHQLRPNRIYFILPHSMRDHPLSASDMASLAVKATAALQFTSSSSTPPPPHSNSSDRRRKKSRVSPLSIFFPLRTKSQDPCNIFDLDHQDQEEEYYVHPHDYDYELTIGQTPPIKNHKKKSSTASASASASAENINIGMRRSESVRKLKRYASRRAKLAVRSFKLRLTTIYEGTILS